jgi:hypothetical protein
MLRPLATLATIAVLAGGLAACGDDDEPAAAAQPEPVAQIDTLSGQNTEVALDRGFVDALGTLSSPRLQSLTARSPSRASRASRSPAAT